MINGLVYGKSKAFNCVSLIIFSRNIYFKRKKLKSQL